MYHVSFFAAADCTTASVVTQHLRHHSIFFSTTKTMYKIQRERLKKYHWSLLSWPSPTARPHPSPTDTSSSPPYQQADKVRHHRQLFLQMMVDPIKEIIPHSPKSIRLLQTRSTRRRPPPSARPVAPSSPTPPTVPISYPRTRI